MGLLWADYADLVLPGSDAELLGRATSCGARRMAVSTALLVDEVIPEQPVRQCVLSFPYPAFPVGQPPGDHGPGTRHCLSRHRDAPD